jgi:hypothetical protein
MPRRAGFQPAAMTASSLSPPLHEAVISDALDHFSTTSPVHQDARFFLPSSRRRQGCLRAWKAARRVSPSLHFHITLCMSSPVTEQHDQSGAPGSLDDLTHYEL